MSQKRALVVDDSRSARVALQKLLERYEIAVSFAESGEEAIDFLKHQETDVIFMDHSMPGMDGFEAVSVIKADPRTAMIPVMMYTAKEGEVYVGQARALGALGVLPKQVEPGVLFEMLRKLGLARERRAGRRRRAADPAASSAATSSAPAPAPRDDTDRLLDRQALGASIQALVTRTLQDQHLELRSDILASNRDFAKRVAEEIYARQQADEELQRLETPPPRGPGPLGVTLIAVLLLLPAALLGFLFVEARADRDAARVEMGRLADELADQSAAVDTLRAELVERIEAERLEAGGLYHELVDALQWAVNQDNAYGFDEIPFDDRHLERLRELLDRLAGIGFRGTVQLDAHLGEFCLAQDGAGGYRPADPGIPVTECAQHGYPPGLASTLSDRQSLGFANFLASSPLLGDGAIEVRVRARDPRESVRRYPFPASIRTAGEWNEVARLNHRVEYSLIPAE